MSQFISLNEYRIQRNPLLIFTVLNKTVCSPTKFRSILKVANKGIRFQLLAYVMRVKHRYVLYRYQSQL